MTTWHCYADGLPGSTCDATGTTQASAQKHTDQAHHATTTHEATWRTREELHRAS